MDPKEIRLKVMEAVQDDVNKGIVKIDSNFMKQIEINSGDVVEIKGERLTAAIADRAYPGDIGLNIIRMDGNIRKNAKTTIGEMVSVRKAEVKPAKKVTIAPAQKGIMIKAHPQFFKQGLTGKAMVKGDLISLGRSSRKRIGYGPGLDDVFSALDNQFTGFGFGDLKFLVVDTIPKKEIIVVTAETEVEFNPEAIEVPDEEALNLGVNYEDIGGLGEELKKIREMVELPLKHPEIFSKLGIEPPKGVLLHGPPGTGKTLLARAVASETNSHFILINGPEIMSKFYGESEQNLRKKFEDAEQNAPSIIFIDEIDAIATKREETRGEVERRVVAQLLGLMDGLKNRGKVIVIAATNMPNMLDPALRRPGRFDRELELGAPSKEGREEILKIHTRNMPLKGSLYGESLKEIIPEEIKLRSKQLTTEIETKKLDLMQLKSKRSALQNTITNKKEEIQKIKLEVLELEKRKQKADENILYKILESLRSLNNKIKYLEKEISSGEEEISQSEEQDKNIESEIKKMSVAIEEITELKKNLDEKKLNLNSLSEEIIKLDNMKISYQINDPRRTIIDNKLSEYYQKLDKLGLMNNIVAKAAKEGVKKDIKDIARLTHGFVGADLSALTKESAMIVLRRVLPDLKVEGIEDNQPIPQEILEKLMITQKDFIDALKIVRPSAMREVLVETPDIGWTDIGGLEDIKDKLKEAVEWPLKNPDIFKRMGIRPPRGILLYGPPGSGKTMLAKAVAKESEANFILVNGPSLLSKWVGESEKAVREIFRKARQTAPTILFFDEIDAMVPRRSSGDDTKVTERIVNQFLTEMDGLESLNDVLVLGATNRPDMVDPALLRQGRFDRIIYTPVPDEASRKKIFEIYLKKMPVVKEINASELAKKTDGYVGADIEGVCREAGMIALRENIKSKEILMKHFLKALEVVKPSVDAEVEEAYKKFEDYFGSARAKEIKKKDRVSYVG